MSVQLHLFGPPRITIDNETKLLNGTNTAVLSLLALSPATQFKLTRSRLAGTIWPDTDEEHARQLLSNALYRLRRSFLTDCHLTTDSETIHLQDIYIDVAHFQTLSESNEIDQLQKAITLYSGDLLEGHDPLWALPMRAELRETFFNLLSRAASAYEEMGDFDNALLAANKWSLVDPLNERAHTAVMKLCVQLGRYGIAIQQYETLTQLLEEELGVTPLPETQQLFELITNERQKISATQSTQKTIPFVGRQQERSQLIHKLDSLTTGGGVALLEGEPGMGKTRLLSEISKSADWRHIRVAWGKQAEHQEDELYAPLPAALRTLATTPWLDQIRPQLTQNNKKSLSVWFPTLLDQVSTYKTAVSPTTNKQSLPIQFAIQKLLRLLTDGCPTLLIFDDLQWAEAAFWELLPHLLQVCEERPLLIVLSFRSQEMRQNKIAWQMIKEVERTFHPVHINLQGFQPNECQELAHHLGKTLSQKQTVALLQISNGNPLFLKEIIISKQHQSDSFEAAMQSRLRLLSSETIRALSAAAVLGREFTFNVWQLTFDAPIDLVSLLKSRLLIETKKGLAFEHDLVRAYIYSVLSGDARYFWHQRAAEAIPANHQTFATIGWHYEKAKNWAKAAYFYQKTAVFAQQVDDLKSARKYCDRALQKEALLSLDENTIMELQLLKFELKHSSTWNAQDEITFNQLEDQIKKLDEPTLFIRLLLLKSRLILSKGGGDQLEELFDHILELTENLGDRVEQVKTLNDVSYKIGAYVRNTEKAISISQRAIKIAETLPEHPYLLVNAILVLTSSHLYQRNLEDILDNLLWAEAIVEQNLDLAPLRGELLFYQAVWAQLSGDWDQARAKQHELINLHRRNNNITELLGALHNAGNIAVFTCQFEEGIMFAEELLAIAEAHILEMDSYYIHIYRAFAVEAYSAIGAFEEANFIADQLWEWCSNEGKGQPKIQALTAIAILRFDEKNYEAAYQTGLKILDAIKFEASSTSRPYILLAELASLTGRAEIATTYMEKAHTKFKPGLISTNSCYYYYVNYLIDQSVENLAQAHDILLGCAQKFNDSSLRIDFIQRSSTHRDLFKAMSTFRNFKNISLARVDAQKGKTLTEEEKVSVWWTVDNGAADAKILSEKGKIALRHHRLRRLISQADIYDAIATHADLAETLGVTIRTIERDSKLLFEQGFPLQTRGQVKQTVG